MHFSGFFRAETLQYRSFALGGAVTAHLGAAPQEQRFETPAASHQRLDPVPSDLVAPRNIQVFQASASLAAEGR